MKLLFAILSLVYFTLASANEVTPTTESHGCPVKSIAGSYSYDITLPNNPDHWGGIKAEFSTCGSGNTQSPIDFPLVDTVNMKPRSSGPNPNLKRGNFTFGSATFNWAMSCSDEVGCGQTKFNGTSYDLFNVHFHSPSEHHMNGRSYPLEVHFVHSSAKGKLMVVGTMFDYPDEKSYQGQIVDKAIHDYGHNRELNAIIQKLDNGDSEFSMDMSKMVDHDMGYCSYKGSLTTPPCTESVTWFMSMHVPTVSRRQVHHYVSSVGTSIDGNHRPTQPMNGRPVTCYVA